ASAVKIAAGHASAFPFSTKRATAHVVSASAIARTSMSGVCAAVDPASSDAKKIATIAITSRAHGGTGSERSETTNIATIADAITASYAASPIASADGHATATRFGTSIDTSAAAGNRIVRRCIAPRTTAKTATDITAPIA